MAIAMKLKFVDVIQDGSLKNTYVNGKKSGYKFDVRLSYYRGHFLSVIDTLEVIVDGEPVKKKTLHSAFMTKNLVCHSFMIWYLNSGQL